MNITDTSDFALKLLFMCGLTDIPGPPHVSLWQFYFQLFPVNRAICPPINPNLDVFFKLYTRKNRFEPHFIEKDNDARLRDSGMDFSKPSVMYFHGYIEKSSESLELEFKDAYLDYGDYNIINVDMRRLFSGPEFLTAVMNSIVIGKYTAGMICYLKSKGLNLETLHLMGISLGAQVIANIADNLQCGRLKKVTALEAGGILFKYFPEKYKLDKGDADFVTALHTTIYIGYPKAIGHVDFWVNDPAVLQPGCILHTIEDTMPPIPDVLMCSHRRSLELYIEALSMKSLQGIQCEDRLEYKLGHCDNNKKLYLTPDIDERARGNYYLETNAVRPYGKD